MSRKQDLNECYACGDLRVKGVIIEGNFYCKNCYNEVPLVSGEKQNENL